MPQDTHALISFGKEEKHQVPHCSILHLALPSSLISSYRLASSSGRPMRSVQVSGLVLGGKCAQKENKRDERRKEGRRREGMKFCQYLTALDSSAPAEWRSKFLNYKRLKKAIKQLR